ncbi:MAG TPA: efflux RND transporter periplasmic adaptor subunit, partial [Candidatus Eisenbacteria bacterium]|nr:efflux RND transporter periplasmic adaptor subunit [Candidatus Eisenbacteria bacterium]
ATADAAPSALPAAVEATRAEDSLAARESAADESFATALVPLRDVQIVARVEGEVVAVDIEEGRRVQAGARLAQIDDREQRAAVSERDAEFSRAEAAWLRVKKLNDQKVISDEQFIAARSDWQVAAAQRDRAHLELERCAVRSPIAGVVEQRRVQRGQMVKPGDPLFRIGDPDTLRAELLLPEARLGTVRLGQKVQIIPAAGSAPRIATITRIDPLVDPASSTFRVVIDIDNRAGNIHGGVSARVVLEPATAPPR